MYTVPGTSSGRNASKTIEGQITSSIYSHIANQRYSEALSILNKHLVVHKTSRAALSLSAYCKYMTRDFDGAASVYEQLIILYPNVSDHRYNCALALFHSGRLEEALKATVNIDEFDMEYRDKVTKLRAMIKYESEDIQGTRSFLNTLPTEDAEGEIIEGCALFKEENYSDALDMFSKAATKLGSMPYLSYNCALCNYHLGQFSAARKHILEIIEKGIKEHPELGSYSEEPLSRGVKNSLVLFETSLIEAFNLKASIEFLMHNETSARESLRDMPQRSEDELDPIVLHNRALFDSANDLDESFAVLEYLLESSSPPRTTLSNLLLLYIRDGDFVRAADLKAQYAFRVQDDLSPEFNELLDALLMQTASAEDSFRQLEIIASKHVENLRRLAKNVHDARNTHDSGKIKDAMRAYEEEEEKYLPVLMAQAKLYWDVQNYQQVENIFRHSMDLCSEHNIWRLNVAHVLYMQGNRFKEAIRYYEPIVHQNADNLLNVQAIVLANLCVSYIMTSKNELAEELMRTIEREEESALLENPDQKTLSLCTVNLVIGTLYCAKGNFEFGISRVMKSLEDFARKLDTDTWYYAKLCFLSLSAMLARHMVVLKDSVFKEIFGFLKQCDVWGKKLPASVNRPKQGEKMRTISQEARILMAFYLKLRDFC